MDFCPFMSNAQGKVECSKECALYLSSENGWKWNGKPWSGCTLSQHMYQAQLIKVDTSKVADCYFDPGVTGLDDVYLPYLQVNTNVNSKKRR